MNIFDIMLSVAQILALMRFFW